MDSTGGYAHAAAGGTQDPHFAMNLKLLQK